ncbi:hypothetical protein EMPS_00251 [Entomortierella parvispora]|uniref:Uncharacterized protein n=1 Tax=Entomortierella parvispora TaxID=205924 RepID=A0A9P3H081_9FUNG|nr:hypothetical protein EMPS_00251 [Entomortierella parvispora]
MVYATRSRVITPSTVITPRSSGIKKATTPISQKKAIISTGDSHLRHATDGKDHHVVENDGLDHHHIWYKDFALANRNHDGQSQAEPAPGLQPRTHSSSNSSASHVARSRRKHALDGFDDAIHAGEGAAKASKLSSHSSAIFNSRHESHGDSGHDLRGGRHGSPTIQSTSISGSKHVSEKGTVSAKTTKSSTPMHHIETVNLSRDGHHATSHRFQGTDSTTTTTTTTTTSTALQKEHRERIIHDESRTRVLTQKSQLDRQKARDAILSLDNDVMLLQKLIQEKEDALRAAEARMSEFQQVTIRTETLTREIHDLEITIRDLRTNIQSKDKALEDTKHQLIQDRHKGKEQQKQLQHEISKLNTHLKAKEQVQEHSEHIQKNLDEANKQRARLMVEVREISENLKGREADLKGAQSALQSLERINHKHSEKTQRLEDELRMVKKGLSEHEHELKDCHREIKSLEGSHEKVRALSLQLQHLRDQLKDTEHQYRELEKENKSLTQDSYRAHKLSEQVRVLKDDINDREIQLSKALKSVQELEGFKDQAEELEEELEELRDQVIVQEKHLTYLENALEAHENCAVEALKLQDQIDMLENRLHEKETMITALEEANQDLNQKDNRIQTLQAEIKTILHEMESKGHHAQKLKEKADHDIAKISSTANTLRTEVEGLRQELKDKNHALKQAHKTGEAFETERDKNMTLTVEITRLERIVADKDRQVNDLEKIVESLKHHSDRADHLENQVKQLEKDAKHARGAADQASKDMASTSANAANMVIELDTLREKLDYAEKASHLNKKIAEQSSKDLAATSSTASQLVVEVESLRDKLNHKEKQLAHADKNAKDLEHKAAHIQELLAKIAGLEESSHHHLTRAHNAEDKSTSLEADIRSMEVRLSELQNQLHAKETGLSVSLEKANKDHETTTKSLHDMRGVVADLKKQLKNAEKETKHQIRAKEDQIAKLQGEIREWENHEEGWVIKTTDLTQELERGTDLVRHNEKALHDLKHKLNDQNIEIGRLNEVINSARGELAEDRKRRASEIEEQVKEHTHNYHNDKAQLKGRISELENEIKHLEKRIRLDHDHEIKEQELGEQIRELNYWKQNATEQTKEWEITVANLEKEKEAQVALLTLNERQIQTLQSQVDESDVWRQKAIEQAGKLTAMIMRLEKELVVLRGTLAEHDANDVRQTERIRTLHVEIESLEATRDELQREIRAKDSHVHDLEERLRDEINSYKARFVDARKDLAAKDQKIEALNARISEYTRHNVDLELRVSKDRDMLSQLESTLDKLRHSLASQMEKYKAVESKYQSTLAIQADQDKQLYQLEKKMDRISAEDMEKQKQLHSKNRHLEKELDDASNKIDDLQVEVHNVTRKYHETLKLLENANAKMFKMVPAEKANHDACATRIHAGEKEVTKLSNRIADLKATVDSLSADLIVREEQWKVSEHDYKSRIHSLTKSQHTLETELRNAGKQREQERLVHSQDRVRAQNEKQLDEELIQSLRHQVQQMQKEFTTMETRMRRERSATRDLVELLGNLRQSIKRGSEAELRSLDELEKELKTRESVVEETIQITRSRVDSGAFLESHDSGNTSALQSRRRAAAH